MAHAMILEGIDPSQRHEGDSLLEQMGHDIRAATDEKYKRATWGLRPEHVAGQQEVLDELAGRRDQRSPQEIIDEMGRR